MSYPIATVQNWNRYAPFFSEHEFACKHCGKSLMRPRFMDRLYELRQQYGKPMLFSSGYRCPDHPVEAGKSNGPGVHTLGCAADILVSGREAFELLRLAVAAGFTGAGVAQKGANRYLHLDDAPDSLRFVRPMIWSY
jgi:zinc D-Ala-D-Ala carboxypeptidase